MGKINAVITGVGGWVPTYILDNEEMSTIVDTSDEWIMERIGVKTRHIVYDDKGCKAIARQDWCGSRLCRDGACGNSYS